MRDDRTADIDRNTGAHIALGFAADTRRRHDDGSAVLTCAAKRWNRVDARHHLGDPRKRELLDVRLIDLRQAAVATGRVIAGIGRPRLAERLIKPLRVKSTARLPADGDRYREHGQEAENSTGHLRVARYAVRLCMSVSRSSVIRRRWPSRGLFTSTNGDSPSRRK